MNCIVTAGPTYEPIDEVRRLTNFSTGKLGAELASFLSANGHTVTLLRGHYALFRGGEIALDILEFTTPDDLLARLLSLAKRPVDAIFHAAAVGDFKVGRVWIRGPGDSLIEATARKISSRNSGLLVELTPATKIISHLRSNFPNALIVGWRFGVDGDRSEIADSGKRQIVENQTDACVLNGPAYGEGYGLLAQGGRLEHHSNSVGLFRTLEKNLRAGRRSL